MVVLISNTLNVHVKYVMCAHSVHVESSKHMHAIVIAFHTSTELLMNYCNSAGQNLNTIQLAHVLYCLVNQLLLAQLERYSVNQLASVNVKWTFIML